MGKNFGIINMVAIVYIAALLFGYLIYTQKEKNEIEQLKLSYAIDYASDAGAQQLLGAGMLDMDYANYKAFNVDPQQVLDTFIDVFCFNYDMPPVAANRQMIKDYIPAAAVAMFDGYYIASHRPVQFYKEGATPQEQAAYGADRQLRFGLKQAYGYRTTAARYALNMGLDYTYRLTDSGFEKYDGLPPDETGSMMTKEYAMKWINNLVAGDLAAAIHEENSVNYSWKNRFYIPSQLTSQTGVNAIEGPSFLVLVQGVRLTSAKPIDGFSVSGTKIDQARMLIGYERSGKRYYAFADRVPAGSETPTMMFSTMKEAAQAGYEFDWKYMAGGGPP